MSEYSVPESIRKFKPKGTMVKRISNNYYVYEWYLFNNAMFADIRKDCANFLPLVNKFEAENLRVSNDGIYTYKLPIVENELGWGLEIHFYRDSNSGKYIAILINIYLS